MKKADFPLVMRITASLSFGLTAALWLLYGQLPRPWVLACAITATVTFYHFAMRLLVGWLVPAVTHYRLDFRHFWFRPRSWEAPLYRALRLRRWKKYIPTYDPGMYDLTRNSLLQIIRNTCGSEVVHEGIMLLSFLPLLLIPRFGEPLVFWTTSLVSALVDGVFVLAQRFNRPRLVRMYERQEAASPCETTPTKPQIK